MRTVGSRIGQNLALFVHHCIQIFGYSDGLLTVVHSDDVLEWNVSLELAGQRRANTNHHLCATIKLDKTFPTST